MKIGLRKVCVILTMAAAAFAAAQAAAQDYSVLYSFGRTNGDAASPVCGLTLGSDGMFYGATSGGGSNSAGTIFRIGQNGSNCTVLYHFGGSNYDGLGPAAGVLEASDGMLYGTTWTGGTLGFGTIFKIRRDGTGFTIVKQFQGYPSDGYNPAGKLAEGSNGVLYGTTENGGAYFYGVAFKYVLATSNYAILHHFSNTNGGAVRSGVLVGSDGALYGTTTGGGGMNDGVIYRLTLDSNYTVLHDCVVTNISDGYGAQAGVKEMSDGMLYGTTYYGGTSGAGTVFCINKDGSGYQRLRSFSGGTDPEYPAAALWEGWDGLLYGVTTAGGAGVAPGNGTIFKISKDGTNVYTVTHRFSGGTSDGFNPYDYEALTLGSDGALYGTTQSGGAYSRGTLFRIVGPALPALSLRVTATNSIYISWPSPSIGFSLVQARSLPSGTWTNSVISVTDDGTNRSGVVPVGTNLLLFRLQRPIR